MSCFRRLLWLGLVLCSASGCQSIPLFSGMSYPEADARHPVVEVLCVWQPAEGRGLDNLPSRGFGGQVLFFSAGRKEPVKVEGDIRIYVFDDAGVDGDASKPIHQFDFPAAAWNTFLRPSNLGASYQIFIPYTRKGVHSANCSLRVQITPPGGLPVYSRFATVNLMGHDASLKRLEQAKAEQVVTVSHDSPPTAGQTVVTADWSEGTSSSEPSGRPKEQSKFPSIPVGEMTAENRQSQMLAQLRQAAQLAVESPRVNDQEALQIADEGEAVSGQPYTAVSSESEKRPKRLAPSISEQSDRSESSELATPRHSGRIHPLED